MSGTELSSTETAAPNRRRRNVPDPEIRASKQRREIFYQKYRRTRTIADMVRWKRVRAEHKSKIRTAKQNSWINYISDLKYGAPQSSIYKQIRKIRGKPPKKLNLIKENDNAATSLDIGNKLADNYCNTSSNNNYSNRFRQHKHTTDQIFLHSIQTISTTTTALSLTLNLTTLFLIQITLHSAMTKLVIQ